MESKSAEEKRYRWEMSKNRLWNINAVVNASLNEFEHTSWLGMQLSTYLMPGRW